MKITDQNIIGEVVAQDYRTATVFKKYKIDFCCKGNRTIADACSKTDQNVRDLVEALNDITAEQKNHPQEFNTWDLDLLVDYIEKKHHRYVENKVPELKSYLSKVAKVHGQRHPELIEIEDEFTASAYDLINHMYKEESILFPYIRKLNSDDQFVKAGFGTVRNPIQMMMHEHDNEGNRYRRIAELSNDYTPPEDACTTYRVAFSMLKDFENDLHMHIHLENNILFPRAIDFEKQMKDE